MSKPLLILMVIVLLTPDVTTLAGTEPANRQFSLSYWNDNFSFQKQLQNIITPGDDDFMTASFRLELASGTPERWQGCELYFAIFTNRSEGHRFDMASGRWFRENRNGLWRTKLALGGLVRGNLGGGGIQNLYHSLRGYSEIELPYVEESRVGLLFYGRAARVLWEGQYSNLQSYATSALRLGAGPTNLRVGLEYENQHHGSWLPVDWILTARLGYAHYLTPRAVIRPHFSHGLVTGLFYGLKLNDRFGLSLWFTENQYGLDDPHYGMTLSYRPHALNLPRLHAVIFP